MKRLSEIIDKDGTGDLIKVPVHDDTMSREERDDVIVIMRSWGMSCRQIGHEIGLSYESVRRILLLRNVDTTKDNRKRQIQQKQEQRQIQQLLKQMQYALDNNLKCPVCNSWILRWRNGKPNTTCSSRCAPLWAYIRYQQDSQYHDSHYLKCAMAIVQNPEKYKSHNVLRAQDLLTGEKIPRRYARTIRKDSEAYRIIERLNPNLLKNIPEETFTTTKSIIMTILDETSGGLTIKDLAKFTDYKEHYCYTILDMLFDSNHIIRVRDVFSLGQPYIHYINKGHIS